MDEDRNQEPGERMRNIFSSSNDEANAQFEPESTPEPEPEPNPKPNPKTRSLLEQLPRLKPDSPPTSQAEPEKVPPKPKTPASSVDLNRLPKQKQPVEVSQDQEQNPPEQQKFTQTPAMPRREKLLRALWTTASVFSMGLNIVLIIILVMGFWAYRDIKVPEGVDISMLNNLLSGLHTNFEKLDRATIQTVIPVDAQIPLDITVPVQRTTQITLSETVSIPNARVVINTGGLNINSTASVTLPAGTPLTVNLNFNLPVQTSIPVHLDVPVNIPMADTELHEPFVGLQEVVQPIYCFVDPNAMNLEGQLICR
ncbi:MAG: hypothetical protein PVJ21_20770 [Anaerolineales bacterium]|jgi:hypothetical protein